MLNRTPRFSPALVSKRSTSSLARASDDVAAGDRAFLTCVAPRVDDGHIDDRDERAGQDHAHDQPPPRITSEVPASRRGHFGRRAHRGHRPPGRRRPPDTPPAASPLHAGGTPRRKAATPAARWETLLRTYVILVWVQRAGLGGCWFGVLAAGVLLAT